MKIRGGQREQYEERKGVGRSVKGGMVIGRGCLVIGRDKQDFGSGTGVFVRNLIRFSNPV